MSNTAKIRCELDGEMVRHIPTYIAEAHGMTVEEYTKRFPNAPLYSEDILRIHSENTRNLRRIAAPRPEDLTVEIGPFTLPVNWDVPAEACLPLPSHFRLPTHGLLAEDVKRAVRYWTNRRSTWIWGPTGAGKDAIPSALSALTRTPGEIFSINPDVNLQAWFYEKAFDAGGTRWDFGKLFNALVYGYQSPISGRQVPMTVVLSDFDRASRQQVEAVRLVADSTLGRIKGPTGETFPVLPGTRIIVTANTMGGGDPSGRFVSANVIDSSIINRFERKIRFHQMAWNDELPILCEKFPLFKERASTLFPQVEKCVTVLRKAVEENSLYGEFSHRDLCTWLGDCEDILLDQKQAPADLLKQGFESYADGLPDDETRNQALGLINSYISGGVFGGGKAPKGKLGL